MHKWDPQVYEKISCAQQRWAQELLSKISIRGDERILDIGCGDGKITAEVAHLVPRGAVNGLDNSVEMSSISFSLLHASIGCRIMDRFWKGSNAASRTMVRLEVEAEKNMKKG